MKSLGVVALVVSGLLGAVSGASFVVEVAPTGGLDYSPASLTVAVGDQVTWTWGSRSGRHDVVQSDSASSCSKAANAVFASEIVSTGNYSFTFTAPGTFYYICSVGTHCAAGMKGEVIVNAAATATSSQAAATSSQAATTTAAPTSTITSKPASAARLELGSLALAAVVGAVALL